MIRKQKIDIDRDKVRTEARKLDGTGLRVWLDRAIDLLPDDAFPELIADYVHLRDVLADEATQPDLLRAIREFHRESMAGRYYQSFNVNSRNCMEKSRGTEIFIAEHSRLVDACLRAERAGDLETAAEGLELLGTRGRPNSAPRWQSTRPTCATAGDETPRASGFVVAPRLLDAVLVHTKYSGDPASCANHGNSWPLSDPRRPSASPQGVASGAILPHRESSTVGGLQRASTVTPSGLSPFWAC